MLLNQNPIPFDEPDFRYFRVWPGTARVIHDYLHDVASSISPDRHVVLTGRTFNTPLRFPTW
jgi:hypothetical protein